MDVRLLRSFLMITLACLPVSTYLVANTENFLYSYEEIRWHVGGANQGTGTLFSWGKGSIF